MSDLLNEQLLAELRDIMQEDFGDLLETFLVESQRQYLQAKDAWQDRDFDVLRRAAHSLKGSCGNVGAEQLQATCADLEHSARSALEQPAPATPIEVEPFEAMLEAVSGQLNEVSDAVRNLS